MDKNALKAVALIFVVILFCSFFIYYQFVIKKPEPQLVLGFPSTPVYKNALLISSAKEPREDIVWDATWTTTTDVPEVSKWYLEKLQSEGWILDVPPADSNNQDIQFASLTKDNFYVLHISFIKKDTGNTAITTEFMRWMDSAKEGKFVNGEFIEDKEE